MTFFKTDLQILQSVPDRCHADLDGKLLSQFFERGIGSLTHHIVAGDQAPGYVLNGMDGLVPVPETAMSLPLDGGGSGRG